MRTNVITAVAVFAAIIVSALHYWNGPWPPHRIIGAAVVLVSVALVMVARVQLGRSFSVTAQARRLVTTGLYARIRNPIYVFAELLFLGAAIFLWSWLPLVIMVAIIPVQVLRARKEADVLEAAFGDEYRTYRKKTWF